MSVEPSPSAWYDDHAPAVAAAYEALDPATLYGWLDGLLPSAPALVLDVGAGTGLIRFGRPRSFFPRCCRARQQITPPSATGRIASRRRLSPRHLRLRKKNRHPTTR